MRYYNVYFEIYGKKMKTEVFAKDEDEAKNIVKQKIQFHKVESVPPKANRNDDLSKMFDFILKGSPL